MILGMNVPVIKPNFILRGILAHKMTSQSSDSSNISKAMIIYSKVDPWFSSFDSLPTHQ